MESIDRLVTVHYAAASFNNTHCLKNSTRSTATSVFVGKYADANHPGCAREVVSTGETLVVTGADGTPGCLNGEPQEQWTLTGVLYDQEGCMTVKCSPSILIDFSPKGGQVKKKPNTMY